MCVTKRRNSDDCQIKLNYHNRFILKLLRHYFILGVVLVVRFINMNHIRHPLPSAFDYITDHT